MPADAHRPRHKRTRDAQTDTSTPQWEPAVVHRKLTTGEIRTFRQAIMRGRPIPPDQIGEARAWAQRTTDAYGNTTGRFVLQLVMVLLLLPVVIPANFRLVLILLPLMLVGISAFIWAANVHRKVSKWLANQTISAAWTTTGEDEDTLGIDELPG